MGLCQGLGESCPAVRVTAPHRKYFLIQIIQNHITITGTLLRPCFSKSDTGRLAVCLSRAHTVISGVFVGLGSVLEKEGSSYG